MDKTVTLRYNTDMNKIIFAGDARNAETARTGASFAVIIQEDNITVIPPAVKYEFSPADKSLCVLIERALLPFKEITDVKDDKNRGVLHAAKQAETYLHGSFEKKELILSALGGLIVSYITAFAVSDSFSPVTKQVLSDIEKNISNTTFFLEDYAKTLPLNYDYVRKLFKKEVGATPHEYLIRQRMELAANLIKSGISNRYSCYSVSQISEACGFADPLYFSKVFKKYYGSSPAAYGKNK